MGRNYLKGRDGDRANAVLAATSYNFTLLLRWLERQSAPCSPRSAVRSQPAMRLISDQIYSSRATSLTESQSRGRWG